MRESTSQKAVTGALLKEDAEEATVAITDNELAVIVRAEGNEAAYTADEARDLANAMLNCDQLNWGTNVQATAEYIHDLADIVDNEKALREVREKWHEE